MQNGINLILMFVPYDDRAHMIATVCLLVQIWSSEGFLMLFYFVVSVILSKNN